MSSSDPEFLRSLLDMTAKVGGEKEYAVTSKLEHLIDGPSFTVSIKLEQMDTEPIYEDVVEYSTRYSTEPVLEVLITLPSGFPAVPPIIRLLHPVLIPGTGKVLNGNFVLPLLFPEGWSKDVTLQLVIDDIKTNLMNSKARIDCSSYSIYNYQAFKASFDRIRLRTDPDWQHPMAFSKTYYMYSSNFAQEVMGLDIPFGFTAGNKILMPAVALSELMKRNSGPSMVGGHPALGHDRSNAFADEGAFVFQLTSALLFPTFVGVHSFTCPRADCIIVPPQTLSGMFVPEGSEVKLTRVQLPAIESVVVQPHTVNFIAAEAFTGKQPKEFLEASLVRYSSLQAGEIIICDGGKDSDDPVQSPEFHFNVISVKPEGFPAAALWAGFASHVPISFLPAMDEFPVPQKKPMVASTGALSSSVGMLRPELAAQVFGEAASFEPAGAGTLRASLLSPSDAKRPEPPIRESSSLRPGTTTPATQPTPAARRGPTSFQPTTILPQTSGAISSGSTLPSSTVPTWASRPVPAPFSASVGPTSAVSLADSSAAGTTHSQAPAAEAPAPVPAVSADQVVLTADERRRLAAEAARRRFGAPGSDANAGGSDV